MKKYPNNRTNNRHAILTINTSMAESASTFTASCSFSGSTMANSYRPADTTLTKEAILEKKGKHTEFIRKIQPRQDGRYPERDGLADGRSRHQGECVGGETLCRSQPFLP